MDCLKNYISIDGCATPAYNYTVDSVAQLPSDLTINGDGIITLKQIDKLADEELITFLGVWDSLQDMAMRKFINRVKSGYKELFGVCDIDDNWFCDNRELLALSWLNFLKSELMLLRIYSDRINRYTTIEKSKAQELRAEFDGQFMIELKAALEIINDGVNLESGDLFNWVESLP